MEAAALHTQGVSIGAIAAKIGRHVRSVEHMIRPYLDPQTFENEANKRRKQWEARFSDILVKETERVIKDFQLQHRLASKCPAKRKKSGLDLLSCLVRVQDLLKPTPEKSSRRGGQNKPITYTPNDIEPVPKTDTRPRI